MDPLRANYTPIPQNRTHVHALGTIFDRWSYDSKPRSFVKVFMGSGRVAFAAGTQEREHDQLQLQYCIAGQNCTKKITGRKKTELGYLGAIGARKSLSLKTREPTGQTLTHSAHS